MWKDSECAGPPYETNQYIGALFGGKPKGTEVSVIKHLPILRSYTEHVDNNI